MNIKAIIFDLDGTLINTLEDLNSSVNFALTHFGYPLRSLEQTKNDIGNGVAKLIERSIPGGVNNPHYQECLYIFKDHYRHHFCDKSIPYEGIKEVLIKLKEKGYKLAVVTNKFTEGALVLMNQFFKGIFDFIQGEEDYYKKKPDPEMVNVTLKALDLRPEDCIYVGDTEVDYQTAFNAHVTPVIVCYGYRTRLQNETNIKGVPFIDTPNQLIDYLS